MTTKNKLIKQLQLGSAFLIAQHHDNELNDKVSRLDIVAREFLAASRALRRSIDDETIPHRGHVTDLLLLLSTQYHEQGLVFQQTEIDELLDELSGWNISAIATGDFVDD